MGASGWSYRVRYEGSLGETLRAAQQEVIGSGKYVWPWADLDPDELADEGGLTRPRDLDELAAAKQVQEFWAVGTHSILDVERIWGPDDPFEQAAIRPLAEDETVQVFGTATPTTADFERAHEPGASELLEDLLGPRWSGRCVVIVEGDRPAEVYFWGWSGD